MGSRIAWALSLLLLGCGPTVPGDPPTGGNRADAAAAPDAALPADLAAPVPTTHDLAMVHDLAGHDLAVVRDLAVPDLALPLDLSLVSDDGGGSPPDLAHPVSGYGVYGAGSSATFFVENADWADVHYKINGGGPLNVRLTHSANNHNELTVGNLSAGTTIDYNFTYLDLACACAKDSPAATYVHAGVRARLRR